MKKISLSLIAIAFAINFSYAQSIFPTDGSNVGIGTTSPDVPLQIGNYSANQTMTLAMGSGGTSMIRFNGINNTQGNFISSTDVNSQFGNSLIQFGRRWNTDAPPTVTFDLGSGNVGIGTTSPQSILDIGKSQTTPAFRIGTAVYGALYNSIWGLQAGAQSVMIFGNNGQNEIRAGNSNAGGYLDFFTNNTADYTTASNGNFAMRLASNGYIGVGTTSPDQKLTVRGIIHSQEVIVDMSVLPDYVFKPTYHLPTLTEVKTYIDQNHHLPDMPSAEQVAKDGLSLGDMNAKLLKKVEELTLYLIEKDKIITDQQQQLTAQKSTDQYQQKEIDELKKQVSALIKSKP